MEKCPKTLNEQTNSEKEEFSQDRINFKLTLRKKKFDEILTKKRIIVTNPDDNIWSLLLFLSKLQLPAEYKTKFKTFDEFFPISLKSIKSDNILDVK